MDIVRIFITLSCFAAGFAKAYEPAGTPDDWPMPVMDDHNYGMLLIDRAESALEDGGEYTWDLQGWYGGDRNRAWLKTEGEGEWGGSTDAELQLLFGRMFAPYWDWQAGVRQDFGSERSHLVLGVQGVAPYEFEIDAALFLSEKGDLSARLEAEYELLLTQRLVLQPRLEIEAALSDDRAAGTGSGLNHGELGLRLRYEIRREIAPYVGLSWERSYGDARDLARLEGEDSSKVAVVAGIRAWF